MLRDENLASGGLNTQGGGSLQPAIILPIERVTGLAPNVVLVSNKGGITSGADKTDAVTTSLRALLANPREVAAAQALLAGGTGREALNKLVDDKSQSGAKSKLIELRTEVARPGQSVLLKSLLSDPTVVNALKTIKAPRLARPLNDTLAAISDYSVQNVKRDGLDAANLIASVIVSVFIVFGLFSIAAGIMLIFLIFVMLAAERRAEMGMARAVGTRRARLIQQFLFEGYVYNLGAALVGIVLGILVSLGMARVMSALFGSFNFAIVGHIEPRSLVVSFCLGALVTFLTVAFSSYRASRLNIVAAIRDLPESFGVKTNVGHAWALTGSRFARVVGVRRPLPLIFWLLGILIAIPVPPLGITYLVLRARLVFQGALCCLLCARSAIPADRCSADTGGHTDDAILLLHLGILADAHWPGHARALDPARGRYRRRIAQSSRLLAGRSGLGRLLAASVRFLRAIRPAKAPGLHRDVLRVGRHVGDGRGLDRDVQCRPDSRRPDATIRRRRIAGTGHEDGCYLSDAAQVSHRADSGDVQPGDLHFDGHVRADAQHCRQSRL